MPSKLSHWLPLATGVATAVLVLAVLLARDKERSYPLRAEAAVQVARADPRVQDHLRRRPETRAEVSDLDNDLQRVSFFDGSRLLLDVAVDSRGEVEALAPRVPGTPPTGSEIAHSPLLWILLGSLFVVAVAGRPGLNAPTADAFALVAFLAAVHTYNEGLVSATVWLGALPLVYLLVRAAATAARAAPAPARYQASPPVPWRMVGLAAGVLVGIVTLTSPGESDVAFASMAGATVILDGISPYGNLPADVVHGDTYPFLNYVLHLPAAVWLPVRDSFSDMTGALFVAYAGVLAAALAIHRTSRRLGGPDAGWRHVVAWFAFPPTLLAASAGTNDVLLAAAVGWMLTFAPHAGRSATALAIGIWVKLVPVIALPLWLARFRGPASARVLIAVGGVTVIAVAWLVTLGGADAIGDMAEAIGFQSERGSLYSVWAQLDALWAQKAAQALLAGAAVGAAVLVARDPALRSDVRRLAALIAALLLGVQLAANYWTFAYLPWILPPLLVALFSSPAAVQARPPRDASAA